MTKITKEKEKMSGLKKKVFSINKINNQIGDKTTLQKCF